MSTKLSKRYIYTLMNDAAFVLYLLAAFILGIGAGVLLSIAYSAISA